MALFRITGTPSWTGRGVVCFFARFSFPLPFFLCSMSAKWIYDFTKIFMRTDQIFIRPWLNYSTLGVKNILCVIYGPLPLSPYNKIVTKSRSVTILVFTLEEFPKGSVESCLFGPLRSGFPLGLRRGQTNKEFTA